MVEYKIFFKFKGIDTWRTHEFTADNDFSATLHAGKFINERVASLYVEEVERRGMEKIVRTRLI